MDKNNKLSFNPPHILSPNTVLALKCGKCEKILESSYYIIIGIPPSPLMVEARFCWGGIYEEKDKLRSIVSNIKSEAKKFKIESENEWIFSKQNIMSSKIRVCEQCFEEIIYYHRWNSAASSVRIQKVFFAVEEYQRRHTPIEPSMSDYEKYIISLPDRAIAHWRHFGVEKMQDDDDHICWTYFEDDMQESLRIALIPDYKTRLYDTSILSQEFKTNFIKDKNREIPDDQELTRWMIKQINVHDSCHSKKIQFCKIFVNPKRREYVYRNEKQVRSTTYTVVVHYSIPEEDWDEYDI
jgi:hypothetical protein